MAILLKYQKGNKIKTTNKPLPKTPFLAYLKKYPNAEVEDTLGGPEYDPRAGSYHEFSTKPFTPTDPYYSKDKKGAARLKAPGSYHWDAQTHDLYDAYMETYGPDSSVDLQNLKNMTPQQKEFWLRMEKETRNGWQDLKKKYNIEQPYYGPKYQK
jgi:hypothetical protein